MIVSLGGSVLLAENVDTTYLEKLTALFSGLTKELRIFIVVGGGRIARSYIARGRSLGFSEEQLDLLGIVVTRVNARFLSMMLPTTNQVIPQSTGDAVMCDDSIVVMGGTTPGHSTDMVGAELAEKVGACRFVIATNVDGVFDKDPNKFSDAKQLMVLHIDELLTSHGSTWDTAGKNSVIDGPALRLIKQERLQTYVVNGLRLDELEKAITGRSFDGTIIKVE